MRTGGKIESRLSLAPCVAFYYDGNGKPTWKTHAAYKHSAKAVSPWGRELLRAKNRKDCGGANACVEARGKQTYPLFAIRGGNELSSQRGKTFGKEGGDRPGEAMIQCCVCCTTLFPPSFCTKVLRQTCVRACHTLKGLPYSSYIEGGFPRRNMLLDRGKEGRSVSKMGSFRLATGSSPSGGAFQCY